MRKSTIGRIWLGGLAGIAGGLVAVVVGTILMLAYSGTYGGPSGNDFVPTLNAFFWLMVGLITIGALVLAAGGIAQLVAWIGALINTYASPEKTWFLVLLIGGLLGVVGVLLAPFVVMVVYLIIGPDLGQPATAGTTPVPPPATLAPAS
jgi:hypothetical protein